MAHVRSLMFENKKPFYELWVIQPVWSVQQVNVEVFVAMVFRNLIGWQNSGPCSDERSPIPDGHREEEQEGEEVDGVT